MTTTPDKFHNLEARNINSLTHYFHHLFPSETISEKGLNVPGYLWKMDRRIHIPELNVGSNKVQWFQTRYSVFVYNILRSPFYCLETFKEIQKSNIFQDLDQEKQDEVTASMSKGDGLSPSEYEDWASDFRIKILKQHPGGYELKFQAIVSSYLVRILYLLREKNELEVADAIWQSIRKDNWEIRLTFEANQARGWFNSVADFPPLKEDGTMPVTVQVMIDMLQLDWEREGSFYQCWLIDNVMGDGWIAVGKFVRVSMHNEFEIHPGWIEDSDPPSNEDLIEECGDPGNLTSQPEDLAHSPGESTMPMSDITPTGTTSSEIMVSPPGYSTTPELALTQGKPAQAYDFSQHGDVQLFKQLMKSSFLSLIEDLPSRNLANKIPLSVGIQNSQEMQNVFAAAMLYGRMESDWREAAYGGAGRLGSMRAVFDVNSILKAKEKLEGEEGNMEGATFVLTPYDERTERIPHTDARAMSMSWLVQPTGECPDGKEGVREVFRTSGNVRGMWRMMDRPLTEYLLV